MSHNSIISGMGEPVQATRVINEKWLLLIMVGIYIILSCGKEYVKLAWEFICKPGWENLDFLQLKKIEMTRKTKKFMCWSPLYPGKTLVKSKVGSIRFSDIQKYLIWLKLQECQQFSWFWITKKNMHIEFLCISLLVLVILTIVKTMSLRNRLFLSFVLSPYVSTFVECTINSCSMLLS